MSYTLRPCRVEDADALNGVLRASYSQLLPGFYPPEVIQAVIPLLEKGVEALLTNPRF